MCYRNTLIVGKNLWDCTRVIGEGAISQSPRCSGKHVVVSNATGTAHCNMLRMPLFAIDCHCCGVSFADN